jgi:nitronate monooxygenase
MAGACPPGLSIAVADAGGMGAMGALMTKPGGIREWVREFRAASGGPFQLNTWVPDPPPRRDPAAEARVRSFLASRGPEVPAEAGDAVPPDFTEQCETTAWPSSTSRIRAGCWSTCERGHVRLP